MTIKWSASAAPAKAPPAVYKPPVIAVLVTAIHVFLDPRNKSAGDEE